MKKIFLGMIIGIILILAFGYGYQCFQRYQVSDEARLSTVAAEYMERTLEGVKVLDRKSAEVFRCVNCGGGLSRQNPESKYVVCQYCGCNAKHPAQDIHLERWNKALDLESKFTIGDFFEFDEQRWQSIGVQLFIGRLKEYDNGEWETNYARYTSWWMLNERREIAWLIDDGKSRYWAEKYIPEKHIY